MVRLYRLSRLPSYTGRIRAVRACLGVCLLAGLLVLAASGCRKADPAALENPAEPPPEAGAFVLADLLQPFTPPPLAQLEAQVEWKPQPVLDAIELLRNRQAGETPAISVAAALEMRNDSPETNEKILAALGRLPESAEVVDWDSSVVRHTSVDVRSINPILMSSVAEFDVAGLTSFGLFAFDWDFNLFGAADTVVSWDSSVDGLYDRVVMRDDLVWSDGTPITAHDVVFSFQVIMSSQVPVPAQRSGTDKLKWIEAYDDHTLVFFHEEPLATNPWHLSFSVIPRHIYGESIQADPTLQNSDHHVHYERSPVTGGPYEVRQRIVGREIVLQRRETWHAPAGRPVRDRPYFREVRFRVIPESSVALLALKAGDLEEKILSPEEWQTQTGGPDFYRNNTKAFGLEWVYFFFGWNNDTEFFSDPRVRQAMSYAFDHEEMHQILLYGLYEPSNGVFHPTARWAPTDPPPPYRQDLDRAEELLDAAGWVDSDGDGIRDQLIDGRLRRFEFSILVVNVADRVAICNLLRQNLAEVGIICHVRPLEFTVLQEKTLSQQFHAFFGGWGTGAYPDTLENIWRTGAPRNYIHYANPEVDALFEEALRTLDSARREAIFQRIHLLLYADQPYTWLFFRNSFYAFNQRLRGYNFSPRGPYHYSPGFGSIWKPVLQP
jgi:peptide/nickel transport system substrate-binding protein